MRSGHGNSLSLMPVLFIAPALLFFVVYVILPIFQSFFISFHEWDGLGEMTWIGFDHYVLLLLLVLLLLPLLLLPLLLLLRPPHSALLAQRLELERQADLPLR